MQDQQATLQIETPDVAAPELFDDAKAAVDRMLAIKPDTTD